MRLRVITGLSVVVLLVIGCGNPGSGFRNGEAALGLRLSTNALPQALSAVLTVTPEGGGREPRQFNLFEESSPLRISVPAGIPIGIFAQIDGRSASLSALESVTVSRGATTTVALEPRFSGGRILVPDPLNERLVQLNAPEGTDWTNAGWEQISGSALPPGFSDSFHPMDVDFDSRGRIYIANAGPAAIIRLSDIQADSVEVFEFDGLFSRALAIDRETDTVYFELSSDGPEGVPDYRIYRMHVNDLASVPAGGAVEDIPGMQILDLSVHTNYANESDPLPGYIDDDPEFPSNRGDVTITGIAVGSGGTIYVSLSFLEESTISGSGATFNGGLVRLVWNADPPVRTTFSSGFSPATGMREPIPNADVYYGGIYDVAYYDGSVYTVYPEAAFMDVDEVLLIEPAPYISSGMTLRPLPSYSLPDRPVNPILRGSFSVPDASLPPSRTSGFLF